MGSNSGAGVRRAVFLDRDGVLNRNIFNPATGEYESPLAPEHLEILPGVIPALQLLRAAGYLLFLVSNQPNHVKGKASMSVLDAVHLKFEAALRDEEISFAAFYYCFHHPEFTDPCVCRKPSPHFLFKARDEFAVSLADSWMIGDRISDVECGRGAGVKTIQVTDLHLSGPMADYAVADLWSAAQIILGD